MATDNAESILSSAAVEVADLLFAERATLTSIPL
jgi:hypothetical protein